MVADRRSFALVIVLVATSAVFALAVQGAISLRAAIIETAALRDAWRLERAARDGALLAIVGLTAGPGVTSDPGPAGSNSNEPGGSSGDEDSPDQPPDIPDLPPEIKNLIGDLLAQPEQPQSGGTPRTDSGPGSRGKRREDGAYARLVARGLPLDSVSVRVDGRRMSVRMTDGAGLVNVNAAPEAQLERYFRLCGMSGAQATEMAQQIIDWRDADDFVQPRGAERVEHSRRGVTPRNGPLMALEELLYLPAMDPRTFERVRRGLSVDGDGRMHAATAPWEALASVPGLTEAAASKIRQLRESRALTRETLKEALAGFSSEADIALRIEPSSTVRIEVAIEGGPVFEGEAIVGNRGAPRITTMRPAPAKWASEERTP